DGAFDASFSASLVGAAAANMEAGGGPSGVAALDALKRRDFTSGFDVWVQGAYASVDEDRADTDITSRFGVVHLGVDKLVTPNVILGVTAQVDFQQSDIGAFGSEVDGVGFLVGPYVAAKFGESLFAEARGAWGQSYNDINPFGSYEDEFETDRFLVEGRVVGSHEVGGFRVAPEVGVAFFRETQDSYVDSLGIVIPENRISIGRVTFGPEVSYRLENAHHGVFLEPFARVQGSWDFIGAEVGTASGGQTTLDDIRADLAFGATARSEGGTTLRGEVGFDGVLLEDSSAVSGQIELRIPLGGD
ncbi:MAG: autotransporter outer membrane beta-barrel domain-containing protein, partial [Pseudomonadota bacterium]